MAEIYFYMTRVNIFVANFKTDVLLAAFPFLVYDQGAVRIEVHYIMKREASVAVSFSHMTSPRWSVAGRDLTNSMQVLGVKSGSSTGILMGKQCLQYTQGLCTFLVIFMVINFREEKTQERFVTG